MKKKLNVLLLGGSKKISFSRNIIDSAKKMRLTANIFSYELNMNEPICLVGEVLSGLHWSDPRVKSHIRETIFKKNIDIVIPFVDNATIFCGEMSGLCGNVFFPISSPSLNDIMFNKISSYNCLVKGKFPVPSTTLSFPMIAKPKFGSGGKGRVIIYDNGDMQKFKEKNIISNFLMQQYLDAYEYSVDCYINIFGEIMYLVPRLRLETMEGEVTRSMTVRDVEIIRLSERLIKKYQFRGLLTIQFLKEKNTGSVYVMEINPRVGSGIVTSIGAGINVGEYIIADYQNVRLKRCDSWKDRLLMTRAFCEVFFENEKLIN